jgi:hypothetical protein
MEFIEISEIQNTIAAAIAAAVAATTITTTVTNAIIAAAAASITITVLGKQIHPNISLSQGPVARHRQKLCGVLFFYVYSIMGYLAVSILCCLLGCNTARMAVWIFNMLQKIFIPSLNRCESEVKLSEDKGCGGMPVSPSQTSCSAQESE